MTSPSSRLTRTYKWKDGGFSVILLRFLHFCLTLSFFTYSTPSSHRSFDITHKMSQIVPNLFYRTSTLITSLPLLSRTPHRVLRTCLLPRQHGSFLGSFLNWCVRSLPRPHLTSRHNSYKVIS